MSVKLSHRFDKYGGKVALKAGDVVQKCPCCRVEIIVTPNAPDKRKSKIDGFVVAVILAGGLLVTMLVLIAQGAG